MNYNERARRIIERLDSSNLGYFKRAATQLKKMDRSSPVAVIFIQNVLEGPLHKNKLSKYLLGHLIPLLGDQGVIELTDKIISSDSLKEIEYLAWGVRTLASDTTRKVVISQLLQYLLGLDAKCRKLALPQVRSLKRSARYATGAFVEALAPQLTGDHIDAVQMLVPVRRSEDIKVFLRLIPNFSVAQWNRLQDGLIYALKRSDEYNLCEAFQQIPKTAKFDTDEYIMAYAQEHWSRRKKGSIDAMATLLSLRETVDSRILVQLCPGVVWILDQPFTDGEFKMKCFPPSSCLVSIANLASELFRLLGFNPHTQQILDGLVGSGAIRYGETRSHYLSVITKFPNWCLVAQKWRLIKFLHHHFIRFDPATPRLIEKIYRTRPSVRGHILKEFGDAFLKDDIKPCGTFSTDRPDLGTWLRLLLKLLRIDRSDEAVTDPESSFWLGTREQLRRALTEQWQRDGCPDETVSRAALRLVSAIRVVGFEEHFKGRRR